MESHVHPQSVLGRIASQVKDPRSRRGRMYPLAMILGMLLLGALEGEGSLRGAWMRGKKYWKELNKRFGGVWPVNPPGLSTVWYVLQRVDAEELERALSGMIEADEAISMDGKTLRGSKRRGERALQVLAMAGHRGGEVLAQRQVEKGEEGAAIRLLAEMPIKGRVITMDAGLMKRPVIQAVVKKGGTTLAY